MQNHPGLFVSLESSDAAAGRLHNRLLAERLRAIGYQVTSFHFPQSNAVSSHFVQRYQKGEYGPPDEISPYAAALFYGLDHFEAAGQIKTILQKKGNIVLSDGYVAHNMSLQATKFQNQAQQRGFFIWTDSLEFELLGVPRPKLSLVLTQSSPADKQLESTYRLLSELFPKDFRSVATARHSHRLNIAVISNSLWELIQPLLPEYPPNQPRSRRLRLDGNQSDTPERIQSEATVVSSPSKRQPEKVLLEGVSLRLAHDLMSTGSADYLTIDDQKNNNQPLNFYTPAKLPPKLRKDYSSGLAQIAKIQIKIARQLTQSRHKKSRLTKPIAEAISANLTPLARTINLRVEPQGHNLDKLAASLATIDLPEAKTALKLLPSRNHLQPAPPNQVINRLVGELQPTFAPIDQTIKIIDWRPKNELDLLGSLLYPSTPLPFEELTTRLDKWSYDRKADLLTIFLRDSTKSTKHSLLVDVSYDTEILASLTAFWAFYQTRLYNNLSSQPATVRFGYSVPSQIEETGLEDEYMQAFDISLELFSKLQAAGCQLEAGYVVLAGHRLRWRTSVSAVQLLNLRHSDLAVSLTESPLIEEWLGEIRQVHPIIGEIIFGQQRLFPQKKARANKTTNQNP